MKDDDLVRLIETTDPTRAVLLFGAGASRSSGAPLASELTRELEQKLASGERISDDLAELTSILEHRYTRRTMVDAIIERLAPLEPDDALIALARYPWPSIYTTNYDRLIEVAYERANVPLAIVRSHFDWERAHRPGVTTLYKIHGCISEDRSKGHRASMILTLEDYVEYEKYRQLLFDRLKVELAASSVIIIGYSLRDAHLQRLVQETLKLRRDAAAPGRLAAIVHEVDDDRAAVWRARGVDYIARGDLNHFVHQMSTHHTPAEVSQPQGAGLPPIPHRLAACTINVRKATGIANPKRLFYGGAATYADIREGYTFPRDAERTASPDDDVATVITGVAGTGKSTLARRLLLNWARDSRAIYEHRAEFSLDSDLWLGYERQLRESGSTAVLLIDNCIPFQRFINRLIRDLPANSALHVLLTAETSGWRVRQKDPRLFRNAATIELSRLSRDEVRELLRVVLSTDALRHLVSSAFLSRGTSDQIRMLERKCLADMFVCLKVLFSADTLDEIILREYNELESPFDVMYRTTAALEAAGAIPHRQMVLRVSGLPAEMVSGALHVLEGLVDESEENASLGIYVWRTRHEVIAGLLSRYKYSDTNELKALLLNIIVTANPTYFEEVRTLREMCNSERGIRALPDADDRIELYRQIANLVPTDNVVRHRLIRELLDSERLADAEAELAHAIDDVGLDPPLQRYKVQRQILRSRSSGLRDEDRRAILRDALTEAESGIRRYPESKYMYFVAADVAEEWFELTGERDWLEWAKQQLSRAQQNLLDPEISARANHLWRL